MSCTCLLLSQINSFALKRKASYIILISAFTFLFTELITFILFNFLPDLWSYHLPFLYSCISFLGVLMLLGKICLFFCCCWQKKNLLSEFSLVCTPLGFVRLFEVVGQFLVKPQFLRDINEEFIAYHLEEECLRRRLNNAEVTNKCYVTPAPMLLGECGPVLSDENDSPSGLLRLRNGQLQSGLRNRLIEVETRRRLLGKSVKLLKCVVCNDNIFCR